MSRKGDCWDNAPMESFFHTLKAERVHHRVYATRDHARRDLFPRLPEARRVLAQARALNGAALEALAGLDDLCAAPTDNPIILAGHLVFRAELRLTLGLYTPAKAHLREAMELARPRQARALELRAAMVLARMRRKAGDAAGARALLAPVYEGFTQGFDTSDLLEAAALLEELHHSVLAERARV